MSNKKISQLPVGTAPTGSELIPAVQGGATVSLTIAQIASPGGAALYASSYGISASNTAAANSAGWALLKAAIGTGGKYVVLWSGKAQFASELDCSNLTNVIFQGQGGLDLTYSGNFGTVIHFTGMGPGNIINMQGHRGIWWRDLQVVYSSDSFTGTSFNCFTSFSTGCGSGFENVQCYQITNSGHTAGQCWYIRNNVDVTWRNCYASHATYGWVGLFDADSGETNMIKLFACTSIALRTAAIANPRIGWSLYGHNFELSDTNTPCGIVSTASQAVVNCALYSSVFADSSASGTWISFASSTFNFTMLGGAILSLGGTTTGILFNGAFNGCPIIQGVYFSGLTIALNFATTTTGAIVINNNFLSVGTALSGPSNLDSTSLVLANNGLAPIPVGLSSGGSGVASGPQIYVAGVATAVNMNAVADTTFNITLPAGYARYRIQALMVAHASTDLTAATTVHYGLFTSTGGGGTAVVSDTATTISATAESTNNNAQFIGPAITAVFNNAQLFFRVITAHGSAATADAYLQIQPVL